MSKKSFILYQDYKKNLSVLTQAQKGDLLDAIFDFNEGKNSNLEGVVAMAFSFIKTDLEENAKKWEEAKEKKSSSGRKSRKRKLTAVERRMPVAFISSFPLPNQFFFFLPLPRSIDALDLGRVLILPFSVRAYL